MSNRMAEAEAIWLLQEADSAACGLRASAGNFLEESGSGSGGSSHGYQPRDYYPEHSQAARSRLRRAWVAFQGLTLTGQAILKQRYALRGPHVPLIMGMGEWSFVGENLPQVRKRADHMRTTPHEALREMAKKAKDAALLEQCKALVNDALDRFAVELASFDAESAKVKLANRDRMDAIREGRAA